jgi:hypothetical protein
MDSLPEPHQLAHAAGQQERALNHRTITQGAYRAPVRVYDTALALRDLAQYLPQALEQLQSGLDQLVATGDVRLYDDSGDSVLERQMNVAQAVQVGAAAAAQLQGAMSAVARLTSGLGLREREEAGEQ